MQADHDTHDTYIGFDEARSLIEGSLEPLPPEELEVGDAAGRVIATDAIAVVDSPSVDASSRDGFAVIAADLEEATREDGPILTVVGSATAAVAWSGELEAGQAARITTGAPVPAGADAVVMSELCQDLGDQVIVRDSPGSGRNVIPRGNDVSAGDRVARAGDRIDPGLAALLSASGIERVQTIARPRVALLAVGDEVVLPGTALGEGQLYASNLAYIDAWLRRLGIDSTSDLLPDDRDALSRAIERALADGADAVITSGGAWSSHRDMVRPALDQLGWSCVFHRVRIGPASGTAFGRLGGRAVFCLPGGPPSSVVGFLQLALPGLLRMAGHVGPALPVVRARLAAAATGRRRGWTEFAHGALERDGDVLMVTPLQTGSRLKRIAAGDCLLRIDEGVDRIEQGTAIDVELLGMR
jgi:molybdopterin molybdotransferase